MGKCCIPVILLFISLISCTTEPEFSNNVIELKEIDVSCKETFLKISIGETNPNQTVILHRDGQEIIRYKAETKDSVIIDSLLSIDKEYKYSVFLFANGVEVGKDYLTSKTLNLTSSEFIWSFYEFGALSTSILNDICIVNKNEIWAVGKVSRFDESGDEVTLKANALKWDGTNWEYKNIEVFISYEQSRYTTNRAEGYTISEIQDETLVFVSAGGGVSIKDKNWEYLNVPEGQQQPWSTYNIGGFNKNKLYFGNQNGIIYHYDECNWSNIQSPLSKIIDFIGFQDYTDDEYKFLLSDYYTSYEMDINFNFNRITKENEKFSGFWTNKGIPIYARGKGIFKKNYKEWKVDKQVEEYPIMEIDGSGLNNIFATGWDGRILHFNGIKWNKITDFQGQDLFMDGISVKDNIVAICGQKGNNVFVLIGTQN